jgi:hypothetical protein
MELVQIWSPFTETIPAPKNPRSAPTLSKSRMPHFHASSRVLHPGLPILFAHSTSSIELALNLNRKSSHHTRNVYITILVPRSPPAIQRRPETTKTPIKQKNYLSLARNGHKMTKSRILPQNCCPKTLNKQCFLHLESDLWDDMITEKWHFSLIYTPVLNFSYSNSFGEQSEATLDDAFLAKIRYLPR